MPLPFRVVLVGCGGISGAWLKPATALPELEFVGLVDRVEESAKRRVAEFGLTGAETGSDLTAMLRKTKPDIVFDCTVPEAHVEVALEALRQGCHVLGEKPLADSMANARRIVRAAAKAGRTHAVIQNRRYDVNIRRVRQLLDEGGLGGLTTLNSDFYLGAHFGGFRDHMQHVLLLDMAIHTFDAARLICGGDPVSVYGKEWNPAGSWYDHGASALAVFTMSNGVVYTYRGSWCAEGLNTSWQSSWHGACTRGAFKWDGETGIKAETVKVPGGFTSTMQDMVAPDQVESAKIGGHAGQIRDFITCLQTGSTPETAASENIKSLAMVFAAIKSAACGREVPVTWR